MVLYYHTECVLGRQSSSTLNLYSFIYYKVYLSCNHMMNFDAAQSVSLLENIHFNSISKHTYTHTPVYTCTQNDTSFLLKYYIRNSYYHESDI